MLISKGDTQLLINGAVSKDTVSCQTNVCGLLTMSKCLSLFQFTLGRERPGVDAAEKRAWPSNEGSIEASIIVKASLFS